MIALLTSPGADGVGSILRNQRYPSHAKFARLPYLNIQMELSTPLNGLPKMPDLHGINLVLGTDKYSLLLVPLRGTTDAARQLQSHDPASDDSSAAQSSLSDPCIFAILTTHTFDAWQDLSETDWADKVVRLLEKDGADKGLLHAFMENIIPGTIGSPWQVARCDPNNPVPFDGGRVILIGDAAHVMPPQASVWPS